MVVDGINNRCLFLRFSCFVVRVFDNLEFREVFRDFFPSLSPSLSEFHRPGISRATVLMPEVYPPVCNSSVLVYFFTLLLFDAARQQRKSKHVHRLLVVEIECFVRWISVHSTLVAAFMTVMHTKGMDCMELPSIDFNCKT